MPCVAAVQAFDEGPWPRMSGKERAKVMHRLVQLLEASRPAVALLGEFVDACYATWLTDCFSCFAGDGVAKICAAEK